MLSIVFYAPALNIRTSSPHGYEKHVFTFHGTAPKFFNLVSVSQNAADPQHNTRFHTSMIINLAPDILSSCSVFTVWLVISMKVKTVLSEWSKTTTTE